MGFPKKISCRQCNKNLSGRTPKRPKYKLKSVMKELQEFCKTAEGQPGGYDFENDWFCKTCYRKVKEKKFDKLPPLRERPQEPPRGRKHSDNNEVKMNQDKAAGECLFCSVKCEGQSRIDLGSSGNSGSGGRDVIFIFRDLLKIPEAVLDGFQKDFGGPEDWQLSLCGRCREHATLAKDFYQTIVNAYGQLSAVQQQIVEKMKGQGRPNNCPGKSNEKTTSILTEAKNFVFKHNYSFGSTEHPLSSYIKSDEPSRSEAPSGDLGADGDGVPSQKAKDEVLYLQEDMEFSDEPSLGGASDSEYCPDDSDDHQDEVILKERPMSLSNYNTRSGAGLLGVSEPPISSSAVPPEESGRKRQGSTGHSPTPRKETPTEKRQFGRGPPIKCHLCEAVIPTDYEWKQHLVGSHQMDFMICGVEGCRKEIRTKPKYQVQDYRAHMIVHTDISQVTCDRCGKVHKRRKDLLSHQRSGQCIKAKARSAAQESRRLLKQEQLTRRVRYCAICDKKLMGTRAYIQHNKDVHLFNADGTPMQHICGFCGSDLKTREVLNRHIREVHQNQRKRCQVCGAPYRGVNSLRLHLLLRHHEHPEVEALREEGYSLEKCEVKGCRLMFPHKDQLAEHREKVHRDPEGVKPYQCSYCDKGFFKRTPLRRHEVIHQNEGTANYQCTLCGKRFSTPQYLYVHERYTCSQRKVFLENPKTTNDDDTSILVSNKQY